MKNLSLVLNAVLFLLVGVLFYLHFKDNKSSLSELKQHTDLQENSLGNNSPISMNNALSNIPGKVVYVDYDSLVKNYDLFKKMEKELEDKLKKSEQEMVTKQKKLEDDYQSYMQSQSMMTEQHRATKEQQLTQQNQELIQLRDEKSRQFTIQEQQLNEKLLTTLYSFFKKLGRQNNYSYIFTYKKGIPGIVYGVDSLNITSDVIKGLNTEYREKK